MPGAVIMGDARIVALLGKNPSGSDRMRVPHMDNIYTKRKMTFPLIPDDIALCGRV